MRISFPAAVIVNTVLIINIENDGGREDKIKQTDIYVGNNIDTQNSACYEFP